jgi:hypothetical protein
MRLIVWSQSPFSQFALPLECCYFVEQFMDENICSLLDALQFIYVLSNVSAKCEVTHPEMFIRMRQKFPLIFQKYCN